MTTNATLGHTAAAATVVLVDDQASLAHSTVTADVAYVATGNVGWLLTDDDEQLLTDDDEPLFAWIAGPATVEVH